MTFIINSDKRYDLRVQLPVAKRHEFLLGQFFDRSDFKVETKAEMDFWFKTGNMAVEYFSRGQKSGLATTEADVWVHEFYFPPPHDEQVCFRMVWDVETLKRVCHDAYERGQIIKAIGEDGAQHCVLLPLGDILGLRRVKL
jgi:hypothetical protein